MKFIGSFLCFLWVLHVKDEPLTVNGLMITMSFVLFCFAVDEAIDRWTEE